MFGNLKNERTHTDINIVSVGLHHTNTGTTEAYLEGFGKDEIVEMADGLLGS